MISCFFYSRSGFIVPEVSVEAVHRTPAGRPTVLRRLVREKACPIQGLLAGSIKRQRDSKTISLLFEIIYTNRHLRIHGFTCFRLIITDY